MSKFETTFNYVDSDVKRRPLGPEQAKVDRAVQRFIAKSSAYSGVKYSAKHVARSTKQNRTRVLKALRRLEGLGVVKRAGIAKTSEGKGRKSIMFTSA